MTDTGTAGHNAMVGDVLAGNPFSEGGSNGMYIQSTGFSGATNINKIDLEAANNVHDLNGCSTAAHFLSTANSNEFNVFNDSMSAAGGDDTMVGDVWATAMAISVSANYYVDPKNLNEIKLGVENGAFTGKSGASAEADSNTFIAYNDTITAGSDVYGGSILVGDVAAGTTARIFSEGGGSGGMVIHDDGGPGCNTNAIDLDIKNLAIGAINSENVGAHAFAGFSSNGVEFGNHFTVYNDVLTAGSGDNLIVGDVAAQMSIYGNGYSHADLNQIDLSIQDKASLSGSASFNTFNAFNDTITASGDGNNFIVGDVAASMHINDGYCGTNEVTLAISNFANSGRDDANNNDFRAWNDNITAGNGDNHIVGDVFLHSSGYSENVNSTVNVDIHNNGNIPLR